MGTPERSRIHILGNIAQSLSPSQLGKSHADELLGTTKSLAQDSPMERTTGRESA